MRNFKKFALFWTVLFSVFVFSACGAKKSDNLSVENVFPKEASLVWTLDYSDKEQVENFDALFAQFPDVGLGLQFTQAFNLVSKQEGFSWEEDVAPIFDGEWKVAFSATFPEGFGSEDNLEESGPEDMNIYFAGKFEDGDTVRDFISKMIDKKIDSWAGVEHEKKDGVDYWIKDGADFYLVGYGDLFFITLSRKNADDALARLEDGDGFNENQKYLLKTNSLARKNFGYLFVSEKVFVDIYGDIVEELSGDRSLSDSVKGIGDFFTFWTAEKGGLRLVSSVDLYDEAVIKNLVPDPDYKLSLINQINGDGVFLYSESSGIGRTLNNFVEGFEVGLNKSFEESVESSSSDGIDFSVDPKSLQTDLLSPAGEPVSNVSPDDYMESTLRAYIESIVAQIKEFFVKINVLLKSPVAFVMSDTGGYLPTVSLYFQVKEGDKENAKKLVSELDAYVDEIIKAMDEKITAVDDGGKAGLIKKDIEVVNGGGLHKLYFDFEALADADKAAFKELFGSLDGLKLEVYYGLTGDNVFVVALYPDFPVNFGKNVLAENKDYLAALEKLNGVYGFDVFYFRMKPLVDFIDRLVDLLAWVGELPEFEKSFYDSSGRPFLTTIRYFIGSKVFKNNNLSQTMFVGIGK